MKQAYFETLGEALEAEGLTEIWMAEFQYGEQAIKYGETFTKVFTYEETTHLISIYRDNISGRYERPVHYRT